jgi:ribosome-associated heat shock protein Hsp15
MRIDKFIWCIRLTKTRSKATELCQQDKIQLNATYSKASKEVKVNDVILFKENSVWRSYLVLDIPKSRIGAALVDSYLKETTESFVLEQLKLLQTLQRSNKLIGIKGRPTKKDRRDLGKML